MSPLYISVTKNPEFNRRNIERKYNRLNTSIEKKYCQEVITRNKKARIQMQFKMQRKIAKLLNTTF